MIKICIDAGHHTTHTNQGANPQYYESVFNWKLHKMLIEELNKYEGVECVTFRNDINESIKYDPKDVYKNSENRARGQLAKGCDLFLSLHSNGCSTESVDRPVIFHSIRKPLPKLAELFGQKLQKLFSQEIGSTQKYQVAQKADGTKVWDYYGVMVGATYVGVAPLIIEHSFHSNRKFCDFALKDENIRKIAITDAEVLAEYYGLEKKDASYKIENKYVLKAGDIYTNGVKVPTRLIGMECTVVEVKPGAIRLAEINSWVKVSEQAPLATKKIIYRVGDNYTIKDGDVYTNDVKVPPRFYGMKMTIAEVGENKIKLKEINSWVKVGL